MKARAVIGANYGDEGKGLVTDYLANQGGDVVVRFNGGCQAGHTVMTPAGCRHVFSHFGSGTFLGLPTYWSEFCIANPFAFGKEFDVLLPHCTPRFYIDPFCLVTTPWDMDANQTKERIRGDQKYGSCGMGFFETIQRNKKVPLRMCDLWEGGKRLREILWNIRRLYGRVDNVDDISSELKFFKDCEFMAQEAKPATITSFHDPIFEGAQGLMIGQENMADYPYLTPSYCGMKNVRQLAYDGSLKISDVYYVSRTYLTRHGIGPLPCEKPAYFGFPDDTNIRNEWQGKLRFAQVDMRALRKRIYADYEKPKLVLTHANEVKPSRYIKADILVYGETRDDFKQQVAKAA